MLRAVAAGERPCDRRGTGVATVMAQGRQRLGVALASKDRARPKPFRWCQQEEPEMNPKKPGPWAVARLKVVTPSRRSRLRI
jgi:hypothetical protein